MPKVDMFRLDVRKKFSSVRVVRHWNGLSRDAVCAPSVEVFKARFNGVLSDLLYWAGGLELLDL